MSSRARSTPPVCSALRSAGTGSASVSSVPKPSIVTASRSAKRIGMKHARDLEEGVADLRAGVEQGRIDDREPSGADGTQPARAAVPAKLRERRAAVGGGEIDVGVESLELA